MLLERAVERDHEVVPVRSGRRCGLLVDVAAHDEVDQRLRQRLHLEERALGDCLGDELRLVVADQFSDAGVRDHHLDRGDAAAVGARQQPLRDDALEHAGEDRAHLRLLRRREELDQPAERLGRVDRVHRREHEMAGLGGLERRLGGLAVAQLADQDHVGVLAQHAPEGLVERLGVDPNLALVDDALLVVVEELDRILDRDDVLPARAVDVADHRGERGRLADARGAGDEDQPAMLVGQRLDAGRQAQALEVGHRVRDDAEGERDLAALAERVDAEAREADRLVGSVELAGALEDLEPRGRGGADVIHDLPQLERAERGEADQRLELAVEAHDRRPAGLQVDVAGAAVDGGAEDLVEVDGWSSCGYPPPNWMGARSRGSGSGPVSPSVPDDAKVIGGNWSVPLCPALTLP